jgi:hypothetical protein
MHDSAPNKEIAMKLPPVALVNLEIRLGTDGKSFEGTAKSSTRDLQEVELRRGTAPLEGRRIEVQAFE